MALLHLHWHHQVRHTGGHIYEVCRCGHRRVRKVMLGGYQPVDVGWLETGRWTPRPTKPPHKPRM